MGAGWGGMQIPWIRHTHICTYSQSKTRAGSVESHFIDMNRGVHWETLQNSHSVVESVVVRNSISRIQEDTGCGKSRKSNVKVTVCSVPSVARLSLLTV